MNRRFVAPLFLAVVATLLAPDYASGTSRKPKPPASRDGKDKPRISLTADPAVGFTPVTVLLTGHLTGVDLHDRNFCHAATIWVRIDPGQTERDGFRIREDPACVHPPEEIFVPTTFTKTFDLYRPGSYLIRLEVEGKDGSRVASAYARVEVLKVN